MNKNMKGWFAGIAILAAVIVGVLEGLGSIEMSSYAMALTTIFAIVGVLIGFMNVSLAEATPFLVAVIALSLGLGWMATLETVNMVIKQVALRLAVLIGSASVVVAGKLVWDKLKR